MRRTNQVIQGGEWYIFAGCTLLGLGIGLAVGWPGAGVIIGAGAGFIALVAAALIINR